MNTESNMEGFFRKFWQANNFLSAFLFSIQIYNHRKLKNTVHKLSVIGNFLLFCIRNVHVCVEKRLINACYCVFIQVFSLFRYFPLGFANIMHKTSTILSYWFKWERYKYWTWLSMYPLNSFKTSIWLFFSFFELVSLM